MGVNRDKPDRWKSDIAQSVDMLDCRLPEEQVRMDWPMLWRYLEKGRPSVAERYPCRHRSPWYAPEERPAAPLLCTYIGI